MKREPEELPDFLTSGGGQPVASTSGGFRPFQVVLKVLTFTAKLHSITFRRKVLLINFNPEFREVGDIRLFIALVSKIL